MSSESQQPGNPYAPPQQAPNGQQPQQASYAPGYPQPSQPQAGQPQGYPPGYPQPGQPQGYPQQYAQPGQPQGYAPQAYAQQPYAQQPYAQQQPYASPKMPGIVVGASVLWIIYGSLALIGNLITLAGSGGRVGTPSFIGLSIGIAFLVAGITTLMGKAKGLLANGIVSIVLGALTAIAFLLLGALIRGFRPGAALLGIGALVGCILITAGILACVGNRKYKEWRAAKGL